MMHRPALPISRASVLGAIAALVLSLALVTPARADGTRTVEATGDAASASESARVRAIDVALADAVGQVLAETVAPQARKRYRGELNQRVVRRARRFVAGFKVLEEGEVEDRYRVRISARVDVGALNRELETIGIRDDEPAASGSEPRPELVLLVHETSGDAVQATFGQSGVRDGAAARALESRLAEMGFAVRDPAGVAVPISRELPQGMPLSDDAAAQMARAARAGGAWVMSVRAEPGGAIRGTSLRGATARATVRVLDVDRSDVSVVARATLESAGFGRTDEAARAQALERVTNSMVAAVAGALSAYWPPMVTTQSEGTTLVEVRGFRNWQGVAALSSGLAGNRSIERIWPRELGARGVVLAVRTQLPVRRLAALIAQGSAGADVKAVGDHTLVVDFASADGVAP